jgi:hypothetical protein
VAVYKYWLPAWMSFGNSESRQVMLVGKSNVYFRNTVFLSRTAAAAGALLLWYLRWITKPKLSQVK